jgi:mono/diheme cytochrome c family protein
MNTPIKIKSIRVYLKTLSVCTCLCLISCNSNSYSRGELLYQKNCANCHLDNGEGLGALIPPLANADYLKLQRAQLPCIVRNGLQDTLIVNGKTYTEKMPPAANLSDVDIANVLNYINQAWGNNNGAYQLEEVRSILKGCDTRPADLPTIK